MWEPSKVSIFLDFSLHARFLSIRQSWLVFSLMNTDDVILKGGPRVKYQWKSMIISTKKWDIITSKLYIEIEEITTHSGENTERKIQKSRQTSILIRLVSIFF